jgi:hypothetical protein
MAIRHETRARKERTMSSLQQSSESPQPTGLARIDDGTTVEDELDTEGHRLRLSGEATPEGLRRIGTEDDDEEPRTPGARRLARR